MLLEKYWAINDVPKERNWKTSQQGDKRKKSFKFWMAPFILLVMNLRVWIRATWRWDLSGSNRIHLLSLLQLMCVTGYRNSAADQTNTQSLKQEFGSPFLCIGVFCYMVVHPFHSSCLANVFQYNCACFFCSALQHTVLCVLIGCWLYQILLRAISPVQNVLSFPHLHKY